LRCGEAAIGGFRAHTRPVPWPAGNGSQGGEEKAKGGQFVAKCLTFRACDAHVIQK